jgi:galactokinase
VLIVYLVVEGGYFGDEMEFSLNINYKIFFNILIYRAVLVRLLNSLMMETISIATKIRERFKELSGKEPLVVKSPGRVNIIGEHTDYNEGFVLPASIDKAIYVAVQKREDTKIRLLSAEFNDTYEGELSHIQPTDKDWPNYVLGVVAQLKQQNYPVSGFDLVVDGDVPIGAGLSSSAAMECATLFALNELFHFSIDKLDMILMAQKAEHEYAGVKVGIMDMFASMFGKKDHVIKLDCRSVTHEYVPFRLEGYKVLLLNTNVKHSLASSEYNTRRTECEEGVSIVQKYHPHIHSLRDVSLDMLEAHVRPVDEVVYKRCKYVVEEIERLLKGCEDLKEGKIDSLGKRMFQTHEGLSRLYDVSCKELDFLVDNVKGNPSVLGARMMGGGFGGCTINLVKDDAIDNLVKELNDKYSKSMNKELTAYIVQIEDGTSII